MKNKILLFGLLFSFLTISSCKKEAIKPLNKDQMEILGKYINAYTEKNISIDGSFKIHFKNEIDFDDVFKNNQVENIFSIQPKVSGNYNWPDKHSLIFVPDEPLEFDQQYIATLKLKKLIPDVPNSIQTVELSHYTDPVNFNISFDELQNVSQNEPNKLRLTGQVMVNEKIHSSEITNLLKANYENYKISWAQEGRFRTHQFEISNVERSENEKLLIVSWNGQFLDNDFKGDKTYVISPIGYFDLSSAQAYNSNPNYISLNFTDPLKRSQNLDGLISIPNYKGKLKFEIENNVVNVYPSSPITESFKIKAYEGIESHIGKKIEKQYEFELAFQELKPQVKLIGNGVIVPGTNETIFPFQAANLHSVKIEIFKIFENNVFEFLQNNDLSDEGWSLEYLGKIIAQEKISLEDKNPLNNQTSFENYAIDLSKITNLDPSALYKVRIGFDQDCTSFGCNNERIEINQSRSDQEYTSFWRYQSYYEGYQYDHRNDPCYPAYYSPRHFIQRNVLASNLGIVVKANKDDDFYVAIRDLRTADKVPGATVMFYDKQKQLITSGTTDFNGEINQKLDRKASYALVNFQNEYSYVKLFDQNALSLSDFNTSGTDKKNGLNGIIYGDRGVWRPGDSLFLTFVLEDKNNQLPDDHPVTFDVFNALGKKQNSFTTSENKGGIYSFTVPTSESDATGNWRAVSTVGGATFSKILKVENIKPNRLKIEIDIENEKSDSRNIPVSLHSTWLHGVDASNLKAKVEMQLKAVKTKFENYESYIFDDPARQVSSYVNSIFDGSLNGQGNAEFEIKIDKKNSLPGRVSANLKSRVFEKSGNFSVDYENQIIDPYNSYVGLKMPKNRWGSVIMSKSSEAKIVVVDKEGNPIPNRKVSIGIYRAEWEWWYDRYERNLGQYNSSKHYGAIDTTHIVTDQNGEINYNWKNQDDWGSFLIRVCDTKSGHCSGSLFYLDNWSGRRSNKGEGASRLRFISDKESYEVGNSVNLSIPSSKGSKILISLESNQRIISTEWIDADEEASSYSFTATEEMSPNIYAHVTLIQAHDIKNDLPIRMYGVIPIKISNPNKKLNPQLVTSDNFEPNSTASIEISEQDGKEMFYTINIVDEGLLDLTNFKTPDLFNHFYAKQSLGVRTWDMYQYVLGSLGGAVEKIISIGGDGSEAASKSNQKANRFKPMVIHLGPFKLEKGQKKKHNIKIPNYVGSVRAMVVARQQDAYGKSDKAISVKKPLMLLSTLPRVLSPGEKIKIPVNVFAMENNIKDVKVSMESSEHFLVANKNQNLSFSMAGDQLAYFDVEVGNKLGKATLNFEAKSGNHSASEKIEIEIRNPNPIITNVVDASIAKAEKWSGTISQIGIEGTNATTLEVYKMPPINLNQRLKYLIRYPHGCIEQTTSGSFPQLYLDMVSDLTDDQKERIKRNVRSGINRIARFATRDGGLSYWPGERTASEWGTNYAGHFLIEAQAKGYHIPNNLINDWIKYQSEKANQFDFNIGSNHRYKSHLLIQAYRLYTLCLAGAPDWSSMNRLRSHSQLNGTAKYLLAAAYAYSGKKELAKEIIAKANPEIENYRELGYTFGSPVRDQSILLEAYKHIGMEEEMVLLSLDLAKTLGSSRWLSTQETAFALLAIFKNSKTDMDAPLSFEYVINGENRIKSESNKMMAQIDIPHNASIEILNSSDDFIYSRIIQSGKPENNVEPARSQHLKMSIRYRNLNGEEIDIQRLEQGTDFIATVSITNPGSRYSRLEEMALTQLFPAGWEIQNIRMDNISAVKSDYYEYQDIKDDGVYTYFDIRGNKTVSYSVGLTATYQGTFYYPGTYCEAMYDKDVMALGQSQTVRVVASILENN